MLEIWFWLGLPGIAAALAALAVGAWRAKPVSAAPRDLCGVRAVGGAVCAEPVGNGRCAVGHVPKGARVG